jgi:hypothetical protein
VNDRGQVNEPFRIDALLPSLAGEAKAVDLKLAGNGPHPGGCWPRRGPPIVAAGRRSSSFPSFSNRHE